MALTVTATRARFDATGVEVEPRVEVRIANGAAIAEVSLAEYVLGTSTSEIPRLEQTPTGEALSIRIEVNALRQLLAEIEAGLDRAQGR